MNIFRNMSIKRKATIIGLLTCVIVLILTLMAFIIVEMTLSRHELVERAATLAEVIGLNSTAALVFNDKKSARETLAALAAESEIEAAAIYTVDGKLFAQYLRGRLASEDALPPPQVPNTLPAEGFSPPFKRDGLTHAFHGNYLELVNAVRLEGEDIGSVYFKWSLARFHNLVRLYASFASLALIPSMIFAFFLASRFQRLITGPINGLAQTMKTVSQEKNYTLQVAKTSEDELGVLIDGFNEMLAQIQKRDAALEGHREELEQEVARRTAQLSQSEEKYRALMNNASEGILLADVAGNLLEANKKMLEMAEYSLDELLKRKFVDIIPATEMPRARAVYKELLSNGAVAVADTQLLCKDGRIIPIDLTASLVRYAGKTVVQNILRDISERKKIEEERLLLSKLESLGLLAGGIAHDFNNILTAILGNISLARMEASQGQAPTGHCLQRMEEAEKACLRARALAGQLLSFAKGGLPIKKPTAVPALLQESVNLALSGSKARSQLILSEDLWFIEVDESQISQVFNNLLINADQAMPEGGTITIRAENVVVGDELTLKKGDYVRITVSDQGVGIPAHYLGKIFDPYFTTKQKGSGLGLATSYSIIRNNSGHITVESEPGAGTTFAVYLPATHQEQPSLQVAASEPLSGRGRILVMDDEEMVRQILSTMLEKLGYDTACAVDGEEAISLYREAQASGRPFTAAIFDLTVPGGMGGKEALHRLLTIDPRIKAVVSSGYSDDSIMAEFRTFGFKGVISKPYRILELSEALAAVINAAEG